MQKIVTAKNKEFPVKWCGLSTIDLVLRFEIANRTMQEVLTTFTDSAETATLTHFFDEKENIFTGYTKFKGVDLNPSGSVVVSLMEEYA